MTKKASRRRARESALRVLYASEIGKMPRAEAIDEFITQSELDLELKKFAEEEVKGIFANLGALDRQIEPLITDYAYNRVAPVDRNVIRLAAYELFYLPSIPPAVTINEAVEIARKYSMVESGKFVNGVLGALLLLSPKKDWDPNNAPPETEFELAETNETDELDGESAPLEGEEGFEELVESGSEEAKQVERHGKRIGNWVLSHEGDSATEPIAGKEE